MYDVNTSSTTSWKSCLLTRICWPPLVTLTLCRSKYVPHVCVTRWWCCCFMVKWSQNTIIHFTFGLLVLNLCHSGSPVYKSWLERKNKFTVSKYESGINHYFPSHAEYRKSSSKDQMCEETNVNHVRLVSLSTIL